LVKKEDEEGAPEVEEAKKEEKKAEPAPKRKPEKALPEPKKKEEHPQKIEEPVKKEATIDIDDLLGLGSAVQAPVQPANLLEQVDFGGP
jgi:hypothetical protein